MVCGKRNDRLCGFGQTLQSVFDIDNMYENSAEKILSYFNTNYEAVNKYIQRLGYVHIIYKENVDLDRATIKNETSKYKLNKNIVNHNVFLFLILQKSKIFTKLNTACFFIFGELFVFNLNFSYFRHPELTICKRSIFRFFELNINCKFYEFC